MSYSTEDVQQESEMIGTMELELRLEVNYWPFTRVEEPRCAYVTDSDQLVSAVGGAHLLAHGNSLSGRGQDAGFNRAPTAV